MPDECRLSLAGAAVGDVGVVDVGGGVKDSYLDHWSQLARMLTRQLL